MKWITSGRPLGGLKAGQIPTVMPSSVPPPPSLKHEAVESVASRWRIILVLSVTTTHDGGRGSGESFQAYLTSPYLFHYVRHVTLVTYKNRLQILMPISVTFLLCVNVHANSEGRVSELRSDVKAGCRCFAGKLGKQTGDEIGNRH